MGIFERAVESGFLDLDGFDGPSEAFFAATTIQEKWRNYCQEQGLPILILGAGFGAKDRCHVEFRFEDHEKLAAIVGQRGFAAITERELTELPEGSWVPEQVSREEALTMVAQILEDIAMLRRHENELAN